MVIVICAKGSCNMIDHVTELEILLPIFHQWTMNKKQTLRFVSSPLTNDVVISGSMPHLEKSEIMCHCCSYYFYGLLLPAKHGG